MQKYADLNSTQVNMFRKICDKLLIKSRQSCLVMRPREINLELLVQFRIPRCFVQNSYMTSLIRPVGKDLI